MRSGGMLKWAGAHEDVEVVNDGRPTEVEQVLLLAAAAGALSLPLADVGEVRLDRQPSPQLHSPRRRPLLRP